MPSGVYERKSQNDERKPYSEEGKKKLRKIFLGRKIVNGHWVKRDENEIKGKEVEEPRFMKKTFEFLEKVKENPNVNVESLFTLEQKIRSYDEALYSDYIRMTKGINNELEKILEKIDKPIRKVAYLAVKDKEENVKEILGRFNKRIEQMRIEFPEAKISLSFCQDVMIRNEKGRFEVVKDKE